MRILKFWGMHKKGEIMLYSLLDYIDAKINYELARKEPGSDGYTRACKEERKDLQKKLEALKLAFNHFIKKVK